MTSVCDTGQHDVISVQQQQNLRLADEVDHHYALNTQHQTAVKSDAFVS